MRKTGEMKREVQNSDVRKINLEEAELVEEIKTLKTFLKEF